MRFDPTELRAQKGRTNLTCEEIAKGAGANPSSVSMILSGKVKNPGVLTILGIAKTLNVDLSEIIIEEKSAEVPA